MTGYSDDLRERAIHSWQEGKTQAWIADTFEISVSTLKRYITRFREEGHVKAREQSYQQPRLRDEQLPMLVEQLKAHPDVTVINHAELWEAATGQHLNHSMMWRAIQRAGWTLKKRRWVPKNATKEHV